MGDETPKPPTPPLCRYIKEGFLTVGICPECRSTVEKINWFRSAARCIHPNCGYKRE